MDLQHIRSAILLSKKLNFTKTAEALHIVQPALSRKIKQLEEGINTPLFKRNKRNVELTEAGRYFIPEMEKLLLQYEFIIKRTNQIHKGEAGELKIGFTHSVMQSILPEILIDIRQNLPNIKTILKELNNRDQYIRLQSGELDIGFATNPLVPVGLKSKVLHIDNYAVLVPKGFDMERLQKNGFATFTKEPFIFPSKTDGPNYVNIIESICTGAGFIPNVVHETDSVSTSIRLIEAGMGVSLEPMSSIRGLHLPIDFHELSDTPQKAQLTMIWNPKLEFEHPKLFQILHQVNHVGPLEGETH
ncbi:LysR substrate-binding domain-containing protein [Zobellia uliginosa]|uniref:LysR substrate-binding domain-containing protein n=1 Tax=Zobellia uliginosa TaxID=143224 RepID=UPI0026E3A8C1|nr:LysR substrate-binding domain-containing protein [Zobellia uliginosa]MDO6516631.1 LysR substrate-binding domain-containing protein [Zobellia uliginosa]